MGLKGYKPARVSIPLGEDNVLSLRGVSLPDVTRLVTLHLADLEKLFERWERVKRTVYARGAADEFFVQIATDFPTMIAEVISICSDEPDQIETAASLPLGIQIQAIEGIMRLTLEEAGGLKNLFASLATILKSAVPETFKERLAEIIAAGQQTELPLKDSIGESAET